MLLRVGMLTVAGLACALGGPDAEAGQDPFRVADRRVWLPENCKDTPGKGIDSFPGVLRCEGTPVVVIRYDHGFAAGDRCRGRGIDGTAPTGGASIRVCSSDDGKTLGASLPEHQMNFFVSEPSPQDTIAFLKVVRDVAARFRPSWMPANGDLPR
jgi:hypothetical protein